LFCETEKDRIEEEGKADMRFLVHTRNRNADAPTRTSDGQLVFAKPLEEEQDFSEFLDHVICQEKNASFHGEVRYAQTRTVEIISLPAPLMPTTTRLGSNAPKLFS